jgi:hypothetical protein
MVTMAWRNAANANSADPALAGPTAVTLIIESPVDYHGSFAVRIEHDDENEELFSCAPFPIIVINLSVNSDSKGTNKRSVYL